MLTRLKVLGKLLQILGQLQLPEQKLSLFITLLYHQNNDNLVSFNLSLMELSLMEEPEHKMFFTNIHTPYLQYGLENDSSFSLLSVYMY